MNDAQSIANTLRGKKAGTGYVCRCPAHEDQHASLSLTDGDDGKVLWKCHAGCSQEAVQEALQRLGLLDQPRGKETSPRRLAGTSQAPERKRARPRGHLYKSHEAARRRRHLRL